MHDPFLHYNKIISLKISYIQEFDFCIRYMHVIIKIINIDNGDMKQVGRRHGMNIAEWFCRSII